MTEKTALNVLNRMAVEGTIGKYAIAGDQIAWKEINPILTACVDILISLPPTSEPGHSDMDRLLSLLKKEGRLFGVRGVRP